ncbi:Tenascin C [Balamuthia mandrillaris]
MIYPTLYSLDSYPLVSLRLVGASYLYVKNSLTIQQGGLLNLRPSFSPSSLERPKVSVEQRFVNEGGMVVGNGDISCKDFSNDGLVYSAYWLEEWGFEPFEVGRLAVEASASFLQSNRGTLAVDVVGDIPVVEHGMINLFGSSPELSGYLKAYFFDSANETDATYQVLTTELPFTTIKGLQVEYVIKVFNSDVVSNRTCTLFHQPSSAYCANDTRCSELPQEVLELYTCEHLTNTRNPTTLSGGCTQDMNFGFLLGAPEAPRCVCDKGFITDGSECIPWCEAGTGCSNHGECVAEEGIEPYCICSPGWQGTICNIADCPGTPDCMGRGRCNTAVTPVACQCIDPLLWGGAACDVWVSNSSQPNATGCPVGTGGLECSGHGECVLGEDDIPECSCEDIWEGSENCVGQCPNDCNGRGECIVTGEAPVCDCEWEWQGDSCSEARFEEDDDADEQEKIVIGTVVSSVERAHQVANKVQLCRQLLIHAFAINFSQAGVLREEEDAARFVFGSLAASSPCSNWEPSRVPGTNQDDVRIVKAGSYEVTLDSSFVTIRSLLLGNQTSHNSNDSQIIFPTLSMLDDQPWLSLRLEGGSFLFAQNSITILPGALLNLRPSFWPSSSSSLQVEQPKLSVGGELLNEGWIVGNADITGKDINNSGVLYSANWLEEWGYEPLIGGLVVECSSAFVQTEGGVMAVDIAALDYGKITLFGCSPVLNGVFQAYLLPTVQTADAPVYQVFSSEKAIKEQQWSVASSQIKSVALSVVSYESCVLYHNSSSSHCADDARCNQLPEEVFEQYSCTGLATEMGATPNTCSQDANFGILLVGAGNTGDPCSCIPGYVYVQNDGCAPWCIVGEGCSGHGECIVEAGIDPYCICSPGWQGTVCNIADCPGTPDCTGRGRCNTAVSPVACQCIDPLLWGGAACDVWVSNSSQPNATGCPVGTGGQECSGHGECTVDNDGTPHCVCDPVWQGSVNCIGQCPEGCNGRGDCILTGESPTCDCEWEWQGASCSEARFQEDDGDEEEQQKIIIGTVVSSIAVLAVVALVIGIVVVRRKREQDIRGRQAVNY